MKVIQKFLLISIAIILINCNKKTKPSNQNIRNWESENLKGNVKYIKDFNFVVLDTSRFFNPNIVKEKQEFFFDEKGNLNNCNTFLKNGINNSEEFKVNENGNIIFVHYKSEKQRIENETYYEYDDLGHVISEKNKNGLNESFKKLTWFPDKSYGILKESFYSHDTSHYEKIEEDSSGKIIKISIFENSKLISNFNFINTNEINTVKFTSLINPSLNYTTEDYYKNKKNYLTKNLNSMGLVIRTIERKYDKYGNELSVIMKENEKESTRQTFTYIYDKKGNWIKKEEIFFDVRTNKLISKSNDRYIEYYD